MIQRTLTTALGGSEDFPRFRARRPDTSDGTSGPDRPGCSRSEHRGSPPTPPLAGPERGFVPRWADPISRAGVALDAIEIQLESAGVGSPPGPSVVYCHMTGVDAYYEACRARGATIVMELGDRPWGMRDFRVVDSSGNRIGFASPL